MSSSINGPWYLLELPAKGWGAMYCNSKMCIIRNVWICTKLLVSSSASQTTTASDQGWSGWFYRLLTCWPQLFEKLTNTQRQTLSLITVQKFMKKRKEARVFLEEKIGRTAWENISLVCVNWPRRPLQIPPTTGKTFSTHKKQTSLLKKLLLLQIKCTNSLHHAVVSHTHLQKNKMTNSSQTYLPPTLLKRDTPQTPPFQTYQLPSAYLRPPGLTACPSKWISLSHPHLHLPPRPGLP